jgi:hypothetical protein
MNLTYWLNVGGDKEKTEATLDLELELESLEHVVLVLLEQVVGDTRAQQAGCERLAGTEALARPPTLSFSEVS